MRSFKFLAQVPLLRLILPLMAGIIFIWQLRCEVPLLIAIPVFFAALIVLAVFKRFLIRSLRFLGWDGAVIHLLLLVVGMYVTGQHFRSEKRSLINEPVTHRYLLRINSTPVVRSANLKFEALIIAVERRGHWENVQEKTMVYLRRGNGSELLQYGDELLTDAHPEKVSGPMNPGEFDLRAWLEKKTIFSRIFIREKEWKATGVNHGNLFLASAFSLRKKCLQIFTAYGMTGNEFGVASALLLGDSDHLDAGMIHSYSVAGVMHVLSVSGMHVAIIYVILLRLLFPLEKSRRGKMMSIILQLFFLWFYAALTGLCPSVLRSVLMLTVVIIGKALDRKTHILNSLSASALVLLIYDPLLLFDVGFQLSYIAVAGIVLLQPRLAALWETDHFIWKHIWTMTTVTLVAQLFTFPIGLYYFRQFPTWFLLSNIVVIPLSTIVLYCGIVFLVVSPVKMIAKPIAVLFIFLVHLLNSCVQFSEHLPQASLHTASWTMTEIVLMYASIISGILFLLIRKGYLLNTALITVMLLLVFSFRSEDRSQLVFFDVHHAVAIGGFNADSGFVVVDSAIAERQGDLDFHVTPYFYANGVNDERIIPVTDSAGTGIRCEQQLRIAGKKVLLTAKVNEYMNVGAPDYLMLHGSHIANFNLPENWQQLTVIVDDSDARRTRTAVRIYCIAHHISFHDLSEGGAFTAN